MSRAPKPILHGADHRPNHADYAGGLFFDVTPQTSAAGGFLYAKALGGGIELRDDSGGSLNFTALSGQAALSGDNVLVTGLGSGVEVSEGGGGIVLKEYADGDIVVNASDGGDVNIFALNDAGGSINLVAEPGGNTPNGISLLSTGRLNIRAQGSELGIASEGAFIHLRVWPGYGVRILDQDTGTTLFRFEYGGNLHMKTGATIIYDL